MLGLGSSLLQGGALRSIVRSGLQLFYKADRTQAPLGEEQVRNNSFDEISSNLVSNPTFNLGSEEVVNGDFAADSDWTKRNGSTINNVANVIAGGSIGSAPSNWSLESLANVFENSKTYRIKFRAKQVSLAGSNAGAFQVGNSYGVLFDEVITSEFVDYTFTAQTSSNYWPKLTIGGQVAGDVFQIDDISVKEVPNWELQSNWSVSENQVVSNGSDGWIKQKNVVTNDESYQVVFSAEVSSGRFRAVTTSDASTYTPYITESGTYTFYMSPTDSLAGGFEFISDAFDGSISNVFVKQLDPNNRWTISNDTPSEQTVQIREGSFFIEYDSTATKGAANINVPSAGVANQEYEIKVVVDSINNDEKLKVQLGNSAHNLSVGVNIFKATSTSTGTLTLGRTHVDDSVTATVSSVSLRKITNSIKDHSKNSNDGILYSGKALALDPDTGALDYVSLKPSNEIGITSAGFTFAIWFKADSTQSNGEDDRIFTSLRTSSSSYFSIGLTTSGHLRFHLRSSTSLPSTVVQNDYRDDKWHRVVVSASPTVQYVYVDNELVSTTTVVLGGTPSADLARLGTAPQPSSTYSLKCNLADLQTYDKAWNATDVKYDWENPDKDVFDRVDEAQALGSEEVVDGDFPTGTTAWELINGATISGNKANIIGDGSTFTSIKQTGVFENGKVYQVVVDVTINSGLGLKFQDGATNENIGFATTTGIYTFNFTGASNADLVVGRKTSDTAFNSSVNSISVKEITTHASHILPTDCKSLLRLNEGAGDRVYDAAPVLGAEEVQNGTFNLGSEEVVDGNFPLPNLNWLALDGATIESNGARINNTVTDGVAAVKQTISNPSGKTFEFTYDVVATDGSTLVVQQLSNIDLDTTTVGTNRKITFTWDLGLDDLIIKRKSGTTDVTIDNVSLKEVPNWELQSPWSINDNKALYDDTSIGSISQGGLSIGSGETYQVSFDIEDSSNQARFIISNSSQSEVYSPYTYRANGSYVVTFTSASNQTAIYFKAHTDGTSFSLSNVSLKEIKPAESFFITGDKNFIHQQPYIPQYAMSSYSKKAFFDGVNDYASNGTSLASISRANNYSVSLWFVPYTLPDASVDDRQGLFQNSHASTDRNGISIFPNGTIRGGHFGDVQAGAGEALNWNSASSDNSVELGKLYHVVYTNEAYTPGGSNGTKLYINGVLQSGTVSTYTSATVGVYIGKNTNAEELSNTLIDEVSVFSKTFSQAEVLELYNSGSSFDSTGHSKYNLGEEVSNGTFELGSEEVVNGDFATKSDWVEGLGFDISGGVMNYDGSAIQYRRANQVLNTEIGALYKLQFTLNDLSTSGVNFGFGNSDGSFSGGIAQQTYSSDGTYTRYMVATIEDHSIVIQNNSATQTFNVDNISVKKIPNWSSSTASSATMTVNTSGQLELTSDAGDTLGAYSSISLVQGRTYVLSVDIISSNRLNQIRIGTSASVGSTSPKEIFDAAGSSVPLGTNTYTFTATSAQASNGFLYIGGRDDVNSLVIDNVSLQEYGLSAYWRNNGADQWDDLSINSNHCTVSGSPTEIFLQEVPFFGKDSLGMFMNKPRLGGLNFNGSGYVEIHDTNDLDFPAATGVDNVGEFSVECWVRYKFLSQGSTVNCIYSNGEEVNDVNTFSLITNQDNKIGFYVNGTLCSSASTFSLDEWVHVVGIREHGTNGVKLYINGNTTPEATATNNNTVTNSFNKRIGWDGHANRYLESVVDDVKLYNRALTPTEIKKNYNATKGKHKN